MEFKLELAKLEDIPEIFDLYKSLRNSEGITWSDEYPSLELLKEDIEGNSLFIVKDNDIIAAVIFAGVDDHILSVVKWTLKNPVELARLAVRSEYQNKGIAHFLFKEMIQYGRDHHYDGFIILVSPINSKAVGLYNRLGFKYNSSFQGFGHDWDTYEYKL